MLLFNKEIETIDINLELGEYSFRFANHFDDSAIEFEEKNIRGRSFKSSLSYLTNVNMFTWPKITFWQSYRYYKCHSGPFYFLQMSNSLNGTHYQLVVKVEVSQIGFFKVGVVEKFAVILDSETQRDLRVMMKQLVFFIKKYTKLMTLRVQSYSPGEKSLKSICQWLSNDGFSKVSPRSYVKTRMMDLRPTIEDILNKFSANGRARLRNKKNKISKIVLREIVNKDEIPLMQLALDASYKRSSNTTCAFDFDSIFECTKSKSKDAIFYGFYLEENLFHPKAFVTGISHGSISEYSTGGSLSDSELRKYPFNHLLMWKLAIWSKEVGSDFLDLGGITDGDSGDIFCGISSFKRLLPGFEVTTGVEMQIATRPMVFSIYRFMSHSKKIYEESCR